MRLPTIFRHARERWVFAGWANEWPAVTLFVGLGVFAFAATIYFKGGPATTEIGKVIRVGSSPREKGDQPILYVRAGDNREYQLQPASALVRNCSVGSDIWLTRRPRSLGVEWRGCRAPAQRRAE